MAGPLSNGIGHRREQIRDAEYHQADAPHLQPQHLAMAGQPPQRDADDQNGDLDGRSGEADRDPALGEPGHQAVARARAEPGADVLENPPVVETPPIDDISDLTIAETGADVLENPPPKPEAPIPDTSDLSIKDN